MAKWDVDKLTCQKCKERSDEVQAAVAAALREAVSAVKQSADDDDISLGAAQWVIDDILALIPEDAQAALNRVVAAERDKAASLVEECLWGAHWTHWRLGAVDPQDLAAAIRKGGE